MMRDNELIGDCALDSRKYNHSHTERGVNSCVTIRILVYVTFYNVNKKANPLGKLSFIRLAFKQ